MFALPGIDAALAAAEQADLIFYSLITLAILPRKDREQLFALCRRINARGGYLAARMNGAGVEDAALAGHRLAGWCVMRAGAVPEKDARAPYN